MRTIPVDIELCDLDELFDRIKELQVELSQKRGINWHHYSYFPLGSFWRFDWEYMWDETDEDIEALLKRAIDHAENVLLK